MMTKREVLKAYAETGACPECIDCTECVYKKRCFKLQTIFRKIGAREMLRMFPEKREFDTDKILTCVTADKTKAGMKGYFGDSLVSLRTKFEREQISELMEILDEKCMCRFRQSDGLIYSLFYPIDEVAE